MNKWLLLPMAVILFTASFAWADEPYSIGHSQVTLADALRGGRLVTAELFYPSDIGGEAAVPADPTFPAIVFAHGYQQVYTDYHVIWETLVPLGYIIIFPTTEGGLSIDIDAYSADLVFLLQQFKAGNVYQKPASSGPLTDKFALMGHSTGGGASYLAQRIKPLATTIISLASLGELYGPIYGSEPISGVPEVSIPSLLLTGEKDCICPVERHQQPLYDGLNSQTKAIVRIIGGDHCGFLDSTNCPVAEMAICGFSQGPTITDAKQIDISLRYIVPWLGYFLHGDLQEWSTVQNLMTNSAETSVRFVDGESSAAPFITVDIQGTTVTVSWDFIAGANDYRLFYAPYPGAESINYTDVGNRNRVSYELFQGAAYYLAVKAYNGQEYSEYSNIEHFVIPSGSSPPVAPEMSYSVDGSSLLIQWESVSDAVGYTLNYAIGSYTRPADFTTVDLPVQTSFSYDSLAEGQTYTIAIQAQNQFGVSGYSNIETFTVPQASSLGIVGRWATETTTGANLCGEPEGEVDQGILVVEGSGAFFLDDEAFSGQISGNTLTWTGNYSFPERGGTVTITEATMTCSVDGNSLGGSLLWRWSNGFLNCSGTNAITGNRIN